MADPWTPPGPGAASARPLIPPAAATEVPRDPDAPGAWYRSQHAPGARATRTARRLAVLALVLGVVAYGVFLVGAITFLLGGFLLVILATGIAGLSLLLDAAAAVSLVLSLTRRRTVGDVATGLLIVLAAVPGAVLIDGVYFAEDREREAAQRRALTLPRPLPAEATPEQVVAYVEGLEQTTDSLQVADALCGVLVRRARGECLKAAPFTTTEPRPYARAVDEGDRVVLTTRDRFDRVIAVRLELSPEGWELVDVPGDFADGGCVVQAIGAGRPPWDCPPES